MQRKLLSVILGLLLCLSLLPTSAQAAGAQPTDPSQWILVDDLPYDSAYAVEGDYIQVSLDLDDDGWADKYGLLDSSGKEIIPATYDYVSAVSNGMIIVAQNIDNDSSTGTNQIAGYRGLDKFGVIDVKGNEIVPLKYEYIDDFYDGMAMVKSDNQIGFINTAGKEVIPTQYTTGIFDGIEVWSENGYSCKTRFSDGFVCLRKDGKQVVLDTQGNIILERDSTSGFCTGFSEGLAKFRGDGTYGYIDKTGATVIPPTYDVAHDFSEGYAIVGKRDATGEYLYGAIDPKGNIIVPLEYPHMTPFQEGCAKVWKQGESGTCQYGFVDTTGKLVVPMIYRDAYNFRNGLALVYLYNDYVEAEKRGYIDKWGNVAIAPEYTNALSFSNGLAKVMTGVGNSFAAGTPEKAITELREKYRRLGIPDEYFYIDTTGKKIISFGDDEDSYASFSEKIGVYKKANGKFAIIQNPIYQVGSQTITEPEKPTNRPAVIPQSAIPTKSTVLVNGKSISFDAYSINDNNYFKLRDLAQALSGTEKQFEVTWDNEKQAINLISGEAYTPVGGELSAGDGKGKTAQPSTSAIFLDGQSIQLTAYTINENNYFKLRDIGNAFNLSVTWDGAKNTIVVDTTKGYTGE